MKLKKTEIQLLLVLVILGYGFMWYKLAWEPNISMMDSINKEVSSISGKVAELENDLKNQKGLEEEMRILKVRGKRMENFLMETSEIADAADYIEKLSYMIGKNLSAISISEPALMLSESSGAAAGKPPVDPPQFFRTKITFTTSMTYSELREFASFIEGGSKLVTISECQIAALPEGEAEIKDLFLDDGTKFAIQMSLNFYSQNKGTMEKFYEYSRTKLAQNPFKPATGSNGGGVAPSMYNQTGGENKQNPGKQGKGVGASIDVASSGGTPNSFGGSSVGSYAYGGDSALRIRWRSFLKAGNNFQFLNYEKAVKESILFRTKAKKTLYLHFYPNVFSAKISDDHGNQRVVNGELPFGNIVLDVFSSMPEIKDNQNLYLDIVIANDSKRKVLVTEFDSAKRVTFKTRKMMEIKGRSDEENLSFM